MSSTRTSLSTVNPTTRRLAVAAIGAGLAFTLAACGSNNTSSGASGSTPSGSTPSAAATVGGIATAHNQADITFVDDMTPHHSGAISMAELAATRAGSQQVKDLAAQVAAAQGPEQQKMAAMAKAWGVPAPATEEPSGHDGMSGTSSSMPMPSSSGMDGMDGMDGGTSMAMDTSALEALSGSAFDKMFLTMMIEHHQSALPMAQREITSGSNPQAKELAQSIVISQTAQIAQMKQMLTTG